MTTVKPNTMLQQHIMTAHGIDNLPLLKRNAGATFGHVSDIFGHSACANIYSLHSINMHPRYDATFFHVTPRFMPNFEFNIESMCSFKIPDDMFAYSPNNAGIIMNGEGIICSLRGADRNAVPVQFRNLPDLFHARNAALEGRLATLMHPGGKLETPISESMGHVTLFFNAFADSYGFLEGKIAINHPNAETLIHRLFETIERRSDDYQLLDKYSSDDKPDEFQQSSGYQRLCKKIHTTMFREIENVCKEHAENGKLLYFHRKPTPLRAILYRLPFLPFIISNWEQTCYGKWREKEI